MKTFLLFILCLFLYPISFFAQHAGGALNLTVGSFAHVNVADDSNGSLDIPDGFTIEAWVKPTDNVNDDQKIFAKAGPGFPLNSAYIIGILNGTVHFEVFNEENQSVIIHSPAITPNKWMHIAGTFKRDGKMRIYINGQVAAEQDAVGGTFGYNLNALTIGVAPWNTGDKALIGHIDEVRYWQAELSQQTINDWMLLNLTDQHPSYNSLTVYHKYNEGTGTSAADSSPSGADNIGTLVNSPTWTNSTFPFSGDHEYFSSGITDDLGGVWTGHSTDTSDILTITAPSISDTESALFANDGTGYALFVDAPTGYDHSLQKVWSMTTQGSPTVNFEFDLTPIDLSMISSVALLSSSTFDFTTATAVQGTMSGDVFSASDVVVQDGYFYTLGFVAAPVATEDLKAQALEVALSPNPSNGNFTLKLNNKEPKDIKIEVINQVGRILVEQSFDQVSPEFQKTFDLSQAAAGVYIVRVTNGGQSTVSRIFIQN